MTLVANRDEFFRRPTAPLARWPDQPDIIAGRDLEGKGTWLGISSATGRFAAVTNIRRPIYRQPFEKSRGRLVSGFLQSALPARRFLETVERERRFFSGFNLLVFDGADLYHLNSEQMPQPVAPGFHGLSNAGLDTSGWPKVDSAGQKLAHWLKKPGSLMDLALLLDSRSLAAPETLPVTGVDPELEHRLSAEFILMDDYGTRCSTGLILKKDEILIAEVSFDSVGRISGQVELLVRCR